MLNYAYHLANTVLAPLGVRLGRYPLPVDRRRRLLMERARIDLVLDIGANAGQYAGHLRRLGYHGAIQSFDPLPQAFKALAAASAADDNWTAMPFALGETAGRIDLHVASNSVSSSVLEFQAEYLENLPEARSVDRIEVDVVTLESVLAGHREKRPMLKIDSQGYELPILRGAATALSQVHLIEVELSLQEVYKSQALFREVDGWLVAQGFALMSLDDAYWDRVSGEQLQIDAIYRRVA